MELQIELELVELVVLVVLLASILVVLGGVRVCLMSSLFKLYVTFKLFSLKLAILYNLSEPSGFITPCLITRWFLLPPGFVTPWIYKYM